MKNGWIAALLLTGCASAGGMSEEMLFARRDSAPAPTDQAAMESAIKASIESILIDPYSAQYEFGAPMRSHWANWLDRDGGVFVCGTVNAKNRMGGYTGRKVFVAKLYGDEVESVGIDDDSNLNTASATCLQLRQNAVETISFRPAGKSL